MGPVPQTSDQNFENYTKKPTNKIKIEDFIRRVILLSDGRILVDTYSNYIIYNKNNVKNIDIKIVKENAFNYIIGEIESRLLIEEDGRLLELEDKSYKFYPLKDIFPSSVLKLSNGLVIIADTREYSIVFINFFKFDKNDKKFLKEYEIKTNYHGIQSILEINPNMIMIFVSEMINGDKNYLEFYDVNYKMLVTKIDMEENNSEKYPIMFGKDILLVGGKNKVDMYNVNKGFRKETIKVCDKYRMYRFLMINKYCFLCGDSAGNIYIFKEKNGKFTIKLFRAHDKLISTLNRYKNNIIVTSSHDNYIKFWDISEYL